MSLRILAKHILKINTTMHSRNLASNSIPITDRLKGKVAIVTASTEGIGFSIAKRLAEEGANVVISSRKLENVSKALEKLKQFNVIGVKCHVSQKKDREELYEKTLKTYGAIDILVSNAAANPQAGPVLDTDEEVWDKIFDVNVKAGFLLAKEVVPHMRKRGGGSIVFVSSIAGLQPFELLGAYSVSKTALIGLTKAASQTLAGENIRVNCLAPGIVLTKFSASLTESDMAQEAALSTIPMKRFAQADEMGGIVAFLVSDDASYITGETIVAAGGSPSRL